MLAKEYALLQHEGQMYGEEPYAEHLAHVVKILGEACVSDIPTIEAAWLHDVLEDTNATYEEVVSHFGSDVADIVWRLTDEPGSTRAERKRKTYPKIMASIRATNIKVADRIANMEASLKNSRGRYLMYVKEHQGFSMLEPMCDKYLWDRYLRLVTGLHGPEEKTSISPEEYRVILKNTRHLDDNDAKKNILAELELKLQGEEKPTQKPYVISGPPSPLFVITPEGEVFIKNKKVAVCPELYDYFASVVVTPKASWPVPDNTAS